MFGLGMGEIMVILVVALLVLGPTQLPDAAKKIGQAIRELRKHTQNLQETIEQDEHIGGTVRELKSALRGDEPPFVAPKPKPAVPAALPTVDGEQPVAQQQAQPEAEPGAKPEPVPAATPEAAGTAKPEPATAAVATLTPATPENLTVTAPPNATPEPAKHG